MGGLDIIKELAASGDIKTELGIDQLILPPSAPSSLEEKLKKLINFGTVTLFMKGSPDAPRCKLLLFNPYLLHLLLLLLLLLLILLVFLSSCLLLCVT